MKFIKVRPLFKIANFSQKGVQFSEDVLLHSKRKIHNLNHIQSEQAYVNKLNSYQK